MKRVDPEDQDDLDVIEAIFSTRSIRRLRPDPIPEDVIWELLDSAIRGPSSGNVQRWGWLVVQDAETKAKIGDWYKEAWDGLGRGGRRARLEDLVRRLRPGSGRESKATDAQQPDLNFSAGTHLADHIAAAPLWIIAVQQGVDGEPTLVDGADIFGAVQNLLLAARKHGIGGTLTMLHRHHEADVVRLLGLPRGTATVALIPLGYPDGVRFSTPKRRPVETVTHWERWGRQRSRDA